MIRWQKGEILVVVIAALGVVLFTVLFIIAGAQLYYQNAQYSQNAEQATALAEAGIDKAITALNKTGGSYSGEAETILTGGSYSVTVITKDAANKIIEATGYVPGKANAKAKRVVKIIASRGVGVAFVYGVQVGEGGLQLGNNNEVQGSIYSNGSITAGNNNTITGDAWVAGGPQGAPDQQTDCEGSNCTDFIFGTTASGLLQLDVAQSFKPTISAALNRVAIKVKKIGNPSDVTVRIMADKFGAPDKNQVLATGTLFNSLVTTSYGWIDVSFDSTPSLTSDTSYWLMVDTSSSNINFWSWQNDLAQSYNRGLLKWSPNWSTGNPAWSDFNGDLSFKVIMGGAVTSIVGGTNDVIGGSAHANTIQNFTIQKDAYFKTIVNSQVQGTSFPGSEDPPPKIFPISDANILEWQDQADGPDGTNVYNGDINGCVSILESKKYVGNVTFDSHCTVIVKSPIWITGNLTLNNTNILRLDQSYGTTSGVILVGDGSSGGLITLGNSNKLEGTGQGSSILMVLSTYDSRTSGISAIKITNTANSGVFYASKGIVEPGNSNTYKELTAWKILLTNNAIINYETGLSSTLFTSGPTGGYTLVKGTYQVK